MQIKMGNVIAQLTRNPFGDRRVGGFIHCRQPPQFAHRFKVAQRAAHLDDDTMQPHNVVLAGLLGEVVKNKFGQAAQAVRQFEQTRADINHLRRQFAHFEAIFGVTAIWRQVGIGLVLKNLDQLTQFFAVVF
ncbi:hypothetical protein D3C80_1608780 [compost metagenome]